MLDWNPSWLKLGMDGLGVFVDGPWEVRKAVRQMVKDGAIPPLHGGIPGLQGELKATDVW